MLLQNLSLSQAAQSSQTHSSVTMALIWWLLPLFGVTGAIVYVVWVSKFQDKFENQTSRSVNKFQRFQESLDKPGRVLPPASPDSDGNSSRS